MLASILPILLLAYLYITQSFLFEHYSNYVLNEAIVGQYRINWDTSDPFVIISPVSELDKVLFRTIPHTPFVTVGYATDSKPPIVDGNFKVNEWTLFETPYQNIKSVMHKNDRLTIHGEVWGLVTRASYEMTFSIDERSRQLTFNLTATTTQGTSNRIFLNYWCDPSENFYGFGVQYTHWNMKGQRVPILVAEQGIGRGTEPTTTFLNLVADGTGGDSMTTYAPKPLYITNKHRGMLFESSQIMFFDLRDDDAVVVELWGSAMTGRILHGHSMLELITEITAVVGRMKPLPQWTQQGAVVGLEGGTAEVMSHLKTLTDSDVPVAAVWIQDWVGLRHAYDGDRLLWNWRLDSGYYSGWTVMTQQLAAQGVRVMSYINPFFSEDDTSTHSHTSLAEHSHLSSSHQRPSQLRNLYREGLEADYFVHNAKGRPYQLRSGSITFCMLDTTNPAARDWMKNIIKHEMIAGGSSGWMADFGEYLPFDAVLHSGESAAAYHNKYPQEWARINAEAVAEARAEGIAPLLHATHSDTMDGEIVYFMRSAWLQSPQQSPLFWLGDQMVAWDKYDGLKTVVTGLLSGGLGGHSITHSDIGGYTMQEIGPFPNIRSRELLYRWIEVEAFSGAIFRTHIGSSVAECNFQVYTDDETKRFFARFTRLFVRLAPYRAELMRQAEVRGWPLVRSLAAYFNDSEVWSLQSQFMFGADFMVAPVMDPISRSSLRANKQARQSAADNFSFAASSVQGVKVFIPACSEWVHLWTGQTVTAGAEGRYVTVDSPVGHPPIFYLPSSQWGQELREYVVLNHYDAKYVESYEEVSAAPASSPHRSSSTDCDRDNDTSFTPQEKLLVDGVYIHQFEVHSGHIDSTSICCISLENELRDVSSLEHAVIGPFRDYTEPTWLDWLGLSDYHSSWEQHAFTGRPASELEATPVVLESVVSRSR